MSIEKVRTDHASPSTDPMPIFGAVRSQLFVEQATLQRADRVTVIAGDSLAQAWQMLQQADPELVAELLSSAAFEDSPLFDGQFTLNIAGGFTLPDLSSGLTEISRVDTARSNVSSFRLDVIQPRLSMVNSVLAHSTDAESSARQRAATQSAAYLQAANIAVPAQPGSILDITG